MPKNTSKDAKRQPTPEVVVSTRSMRGWVMLPPGETANPQQPRDSRILPHHILPPGQTRARLRPDIYSDANNTAKRRITIPSARSSQDRRRSQAQPTGVGERTGLGNDNQVQWKREIMRLKIENDLRALAESQENQRLKAEVRRLESLKAELNKTIDRLMSDPARREPTRTTADNNDILHKKENIIERQICTIKELESSLSKAFEYDTLRSKARDINLPTAAAGIEDVMKPVELGVIRTAALLSSCLYPPHRMPRPHQMDAELRKIFESAVKDTNFFQSTPDLAFRAILFRIIRDQILHSDIWTALHAEGFMLRAYQKAIQHTAGSKFLETFHKATLLEMLAHDPEFETCFLSARTEELQHHTMDLLGPLLDPAKLELNQRDLLRIMGQLFSQTFSFRARCLAPDGIRYEVIHFEPGEPFNPDTMEAQDVTGRHLPSPAKDTKQQSIKLCVHGMVVAHRVQTPSRTSTPQLLNAISQPFLSSQPRAHGGATAGELISGKAIVLLD
ncbi:hypothetical protein BJX63DRAFT_16423 [Aspergillus granulosus]|uniref:Uncharacterized protein n=1 Tax=Aspergillus granulosus TaxID=176169 RepID=A0ABR4H0C2_9EURO